MNPPCIIFHLSLILCCCFRCMHTTTTTTTLLVRTHANTYIPNSVRQRTHQQHNASMLLFHLNIFIFLCAIALLLLLPLPSLLPPPFSAATSLFMCTYHMHLRVYVCCVVLRAIDGVLHGPTTQNLVDRTLRWKTEVRVLCFMRALSFSRQIKFFCVVHIFYICILGVVFRFFWNLGDYLHFFYLE